MRLVDVGGGVQGFVAATVPGDPADSRLASVSRHLRDQERDPLHAGRMIAWVEASYRCGHVWHLNGSPVPQRCPDCALEVFVDTLNDIQGLPVTTDGIVGGEA